MIRILLLSLMLAGLLLASLDDVKREPDPQKRYQLALDNASREMDSARSAYLANKIEDCNRSLEEVAASVEFALVSLEAMGKHPSRNTGNYKKAELKARELLRRVDAMIRDTTIDERTFGQKIHERINHVHEKLLEGVMSKKP